MESLKIFWKDYAECQKACNKFNKEHWKGQLVLVGVFWAIEMGCVFGIPKIKEYLDDKKRKTELEEKKEA